MLSFHFGAASRSDEDENDREARLPPLPLLLPPLFLLPPEPSVKSETTIVAADKTRPHMIMIVVRISSVLVIVATSLSLSLYVCVYNTFRLVVAGRRCSLSL